MLLSVITPDNQPGMLRMLEKELEGIDAEVIINNFTDGLAEAKGDYVCFLEEDSAVQPGSIKSSLKFFTDKQAYRKLAMVSPMFDLPGRDITATVWTSYNEGLNINTSPRTGVNPTRVGMLLGAIIRRSSLAKSGLVLDNDPLALSNMLSLYFWANGLRVHLNSEALYYGAENASYAYKRPFQLPLVPAQKVQDIWDHELIS